METVKVMGKVLPAFYPLTIPFTPKIAYKMDYLGIDLECETAITNSDVVATCQVSRWESDVLSGIVRYVYEWATAQVNLFAFATGRAFTLYLDHAELPDGSQTSIAIENPGLASLATACRTTVTGDNLELELHDAINVVLGEPTLMLALNDLCTSIHAGSTTLADCARAVEGVRTALWEKSGQTAITRNPEWAYMQSQLNLSQAYL